MRSMSQKRTCKILSTLLQLTGGAEALGSDFRAGADLGLKGQWQRGRIGVREGSRKQMPAECGDDGGRWGRRAVPLLKGHSRLLSVAGSDCVARSDWKWCVSGVLNARLRKWLNVLNSGWGHGTFLADHVFKHL